MRSPFHLTGLLEVPQSSGVVRLWRVLFISDVCWREHNWYISRPPSSPHHMSISSLFPIPSFVPSFIHSFIHSSSHSLVLSLPVSPISSFKSHSFSFPAIQALHLTRKTLYAGRIHHVHPKRDPGHGVERPCLLVPRDSLLRRRIWTTSSWHPSCPVIEACRQCADCRKAYRSRVRCFRSECCTTPQ